MDAVFLSHASEDKAAAQALRSELELWGVPVWEDVQELRAGDRLAELEAAVKGARGCVVLATDHAVRSRWVHMEAAWARGMGEGYPFIVVVLDDDPALHLALSGGEERVCVPVSHVEDAAPAILQALDLAAATGERSAEAPPAPPRDELVLRLRRARWFEEGGVRRAQADLEIHHQPHGGDPAEKAGLVFTSPLGPIEQRDLRWYLELYPQWPFGEQLVDAGKVEDQLQGWGQALLAASAGQSPHLDRLLQSKHERRVVIDVAPATDDDGATAALLALPWELLADEAGWLFPRGVRVLRRQPRTEAREAPPLSPRLRVLLVVARTDDAGFLRVQESLTPLARALAPLGHKVELHVLPDATLTALRAELERAQREHRPYQVVHFDGHGVYDKEQGLGRLVFEHPDDAGKLERRSDLVDAKKLGQVLAAHRVPLFVLEACQSAQAEDRAEGSVAAGLLQAGVASVVAMSHSVLVETARRWVMAFYPALVRGARPGAAMVEAQRVLFEDARRSRPGQPEWTLQDWFVPVLFQDRTGDAPLLPPGPLPPAELLYRRRARQVGPTPPTPGHGFVGRSRELLAILRLLDGHRALALLGTGGQGKTALAIEVARWLLDIRRFDRLAWLDAEALTEARPLLDELGRQLVAGWSGVAALGEDKALLRVQQALAAWRVLVVVDNLETALADPDPALLPLLRALADSGRGRLLLTSREAPPGLGGAALRIGPLGPGEGRELVERVLKERGLDATGDARPWVDKLVAVVGAYPRSLVLLAPEVAARGGEATWQALVPLIEALDGGEGTDVERRQKSLLASVRLSLRRLSAEDRRRARALVVFHQAVLVGVFAHVAEIEPAEAAALLGRLAELGLGEAENIVGRDGGMTFFTPDPALRLALEAEEGDARGWAGRWFEIMEGLVLFLSEQQLQGDTQLANRATRRALGELLAWVAAAEAAAEAGAYSREWAVHGVGRVESLLEDLGRRRALGRVVAARRRLAAGLGETGHAAFQHHQQDIERLLQAGDLPGAFARAQALHQQTEALADDSYPEAAHDRAMAPYRLARVLAAGGRPDAALPLLETARKRFGALAADDPVAARMASVCRSEQAGRLLELGHLDLAAAAYLESLAEDEQAGRRRDVAVCKGNLANVRRLQGDLEAAQSLCREAREIGEALGDAGIVANNWHTEGQVLKQARQPEAAERAFLQSLALESRLGDRAGEAQTLLKLGNLFDSQGRLEEAAVHYARSAAAFRATGHALNEARALGNRADTLVLLGRLDEARGDLTQAIALKAPFGLAAEPWWDQANLAALETAAHNLPAAAAARAEAIRLYAAYRDGGGAPQQPTGRIVQSILAAPADGADPTTLATQLPPPRSLLTAAPPLPPIPRSPPPRPARRPRRSPPPLHRGCRAPPPRRRPRRPRMSPDRTDGAQPGSCIERAMRGMETIDGRTRHGLSIQRHPPPSNNPRRLGSKRACQLPLRCNFGLLAHG